MESLKSRVVVVTGGAAGIGAATVRHLVEAGCRVVSADRSHPTDTTNSATPQLVRVNADVTSFGECERVARSAVEAFGGIDAVVACAGIDESTRLHDGDPDRWRAVVETNLLGATFTVRACMPHIIARGRGDIVLLASIAGRRPSPAQPVYSASKWGLVGLGQALRVDAARHGVRVTLMEPGMVDTELARQSERGQELLKSVTPLDPDDVAGAVLFALTQPRNVCVAELVLMPVAQA